MQLVGSWDGDHLRCRTMNIFPKNRLSNLFGKSLKASSFEYKPYTYVVETVDGEPVYDGVDVNFCILKIKHLATKNINILFSKMFI